MHRTLYDSLRIWKEETNRKPLILKGARQTGKTYLLQLFGRQQFSSVHYLNFQKNKSCHSAFDGDLDPGTILKQLEFLLNTAIRIETDLVIFDEIQYCPRALTSLKYFCEQMPSLALCCAGSLLGVAHPHEAFPVGKVSFLHLYPMSFAEFLDACYPREHEAYASISSRTAVVPPIHDRLLLRLREYFVIGGMPAVVESYRTHEPASLAAFQKAREIQQGLIAGYMGDFSKYSTAVNARQIAAVFESVPRQLGREQKKFKASDVMPGGRFATLQRAVDWLEGAGIVCKVPIAISGELPFSAFTQENRYKLYLLDVGLLGAAADLSAQAVYLNADLFATFRGAFCENFIAQEFTYATGQHLYGWANNTAEVEFMREVNGQVYPIEVKSGLSGKLKSLNVFAEKYHTGVRVRFSARNLEINKESGMHSYPLYLAARFPLPEDSAGVSASDGARGVRAGDVRG